MPRFGQSRFAGTLASTGGTAPLHAPTWRTVTCPRESCQAGPQTKCRRWISEKFTCGKTTGVFTHEGDGRWMSLKHPHPERIRAARKVGEL